MIKIGDQALDAARPADIDQRLIETTGCSASEHVAMLTNPARLPTALQVATALAAMLVEEKPASAIAAMIGEDDLTSVREQVIALLKGEAPAPVVTAEETPNGEAPVAQ